MSITNGDSDYTDKDEDNILPPILSGNPRNIPIPYLPMVHLPPDQSASKFLMAGMILGLLVWIF